MPILDIRLVNRINNSFVNQTPFNSASDIEFDIYGEPERCTPTEGLEQNILKCVISGRQQEDGYGTSFKSIIGKKNTDYIRASLMHEILSSATVLQNYQTEYVSQNPTYDKKSIIGEISNIKGNPVSNTAFTVSCKVRSLNDLETHTDTLQSVDIPLSL